MCHFVTATLPEGIDQSQVAAIFERHKLGFKELANPHIATQIRPGELYLLTTKGHCDCGTVLGSLDRSGASEPLNYDREIEKRRQQGWSQTKIQRWLEEKDRAREKSLLEYKTHTRAGNLQAEEWVAFIRDLLQSGQTKRVGLLLHLYRGGLETGL